jgi:tRNA(adenine34) deaminase
MAKKRAAKRRWVRTVKTDSTHPPRGTFNRSAAEIARTMARKDVSPKGPGSGVRMIQYFINRAGRSLSPTRRAELERAKRLLQQRAKRANAAKRRGGTRRAAKRRRSSKASA